jgi:hypothetical protein
MRYTIWMEFLKGGDSLEDLGIERRTVIQQVMGK